MKNLEIRDVTLENLDALVGLCVPPESKSDPLFIGGMKSKKKWAKQALERYGSIGKLAYVDSKPAGLIQYQPKQEEKVTEIVCIFVPEQQNMRKGIGKNLLKALIQHANRPQPIFNDNSPLALVTWAFEVPGRYTQSEFYRKMGFKQANDRDPHLLYYPLEKGYVYSPRTKSFTPQEEDRGKALIFYDPSCPFCIYFSEKIKDSIRQVSPDVSVRMINKFEEPKEVEKRGQTPYCAVNGKAITSFFMDKENFQKEVKVALEH
ncbi:MAG TPA: GNAT family N-acetyltransferase [Candidatus Acidoferrum sp.]|jgi:GNAT superfamily N-acetyltransferase|nr:GNAT family N-acetyltransferase [Candidatus Acidoferrum sp.]